MKDFSILLDGKAAATVKGNYSRKAVIKLDKSTSARTLRLEVTATNGVPEARVFEIGVY